MLEERAELCKFGSFEEQTHSSAPKVRFQLFRAALVISEQCPACVCFATLRDMLQHVSILWSANDSVLTETTRGQNLLIQNFGMEGNWRASLKRCMESW